MIGLLVKGENVYVNKNNVEMIEPANEYDTTKVYLVSGKIVVVDQYIAEVRKQLEGR